MKDTEYVKNEFTKHFPENVKNGNVIIDDNLILSLFNEILDLQEQNLEKDFQIKKLFEKLS